MLPEKITSAKAKVEWAYEHIKQLQLQRLGFLNTHPYKFTANYDPQTQELVYYLIEVRDAPLDMSLTSSDILHNLRSALDNLVWSFSDPAKRGGRTCFPIYDPEKTDQASVDGKIEGLCVTGRKIIEDLKPYKGGNELLWQLHQLNLRDKHRLLVPVAASLAAFNIGKHTAHVQYGTETLLMRSPKGGFRARIAQDAYIPPHCPRCPLKAGDILLVDPPGTKVDKNIDFRFEIAFHEPGIIEAEPILKAVYEMHYAVAEIVGFFAEIP
ncbi:MAG TPA: hypothetical protein VGS27_26955 [Candidatus Sulfotelmatobacter sp.]|nr:hypothetical protein [Candidatus Sulfotelmatobacter sp.]